MTESIVWYSVKEKLPPQETQVLIKTDTVIIGALSKNRWFDCTCFDGDGFCEISDATELWWAKLPVGPN